MKTDPTITSNTNNSRTIFETTLGKKDKGLMDI